jgi:hypothetical protein
VFPSDLPGVNPAILNGMLLYYRLMTKWSGLGDSTELSRVYRVAIIYTYGNQDNNLTEMSASCILQKIEYEVLCFCIYYLSSYFALKYTYIISILM